jgi:hypothetical protein
MGNPVPRDKGDRILLDEMRTRVDCRVDLSAGIREGGWSVLKNTPPKERVLSKVAQPALRTTPTPFIRCT